jgi:urease accessory protein
MTPVEGAGRELMLMLLADARLPTGGHTQSGGLEPALAHGMEPDSVPDYCRARLATVTLVEAGVAVVSRHVASTGGNLAEVEHAWEARTPSVAMRETSRRTGRGYHRLVRRLWPGHPATEVLAQVRAPNRACVLGVVAVVASLSPEQLIRLIGYDDVQTVVGATLKLCPLDPGMATQWALGLMTEIEGMVAPLAALTDPESIPAPGAPLIEAWAEAHTAAPRRLFSA